MSKNISNIQNINDFKTKRSDDFRNVYANVTSIAATKTEVRLNFGIADYLDKTVDREVSIHMTLNTAKGLADSIMDFLKDADKLK
ncbi:hypothetical protein [Zymomonas mobilis]|uniref:hypothetical protein n=1 Tax=Zymomonas mobilis TaxID=542 RepID=UPI0039E79505